MKKASQKASASTKIQKKLIGPCGFYCGYCLSFKYKRCLGCVAMSERAEKMGDVFCDVYSCVKEKGLAICADCAQYPCEKYDKNMSGIFAESFIQWIRTEIKAKGPKE